MLFEESFTARSHVNIRSSHKTTVMVTTDNHLTPRGDCVVAVSAGKGLSGFRQEMKEAARLAEDASSLVRGLQEAAEGSRWNLSEVYS